MENNTIIFIYRKHTSNSRPPTLTLYTRHPCPLCDDLKQDLEEIFHGRYKLVEVDIATKENLKWLRLYRYEIPVLFLEGQYLCKHRLDKAELEKRLQCLEN